MNPLTEFSAGLPYLLRGFDLIREPRLRPYVIIPLLINILLIAILIGLLGWQLDHWLDVWLAGCRAGSHGWKRCCGGSGSS